MRVRRWARPGEWMLGVLLGLSACAPGQATSPGTGTTSPSPSPSPSVAPTPSPEAEVEIGRVLVFSRTGGFRHPSIADARDAFERLAERHGFTVALTEDQDVFTAEALEPYRVVVFLHTTGHVLDPPGQAALRGWLAEGNGWVGIHGAADGDKDWAWYIGLVGAKFTAHPAIQPATIRVEDREHPSTAMLPEAWARTDEWYNFDRNPRGKAHVLATLDEHTFDGGGMGDDHPIAWCQAYGGGRSFYTALGHTEASWTEPLFLDHVLGGLRWAAGAAGDSAGDCRPG
jgi:type 1 glutamine amidotransferase